MNLPITTTNKDIKKIIHKNELMHKYAINKANENVNETENGNEFKEKALQRILNPELRFIDEFFWYWPSADNTNVIDNAISAVINNKLPEAVSIWGKREQNGSESYVSTHNLAVCYHALALDIDKEKSKKTLLIMTKIKRLSTGNSFITGATVTKNNNFWQRVQQRVIFNDPRINYPLPIKNQLRKPYYDKCRQCLEYSK